MFISRKGIIILNFYPAKARKNILNKRLRNIFPLPIFLM